MNPARPRLDTFLATRPLSFTSLWLALGTVGCTALVAVLIGNTAAAIAMAAAGLLVAVLGLRPIRHAHASEQRKLGALLNAVPEGVLEMDAAGRIVFVNQQLCDLFGYLPDELLGEPVERLVPPGAREAHAQRRSSFWNSSRSRPMGSGMEISGVRKDGALIAVDISLSRLETRSRTVMYCLIRDNSVRRAFETQLLDSNRRLTESVTTLERHSRDLQILSEMGEVLHSSNNEIELCAIVARTMQRLFPECSGAMYMLTESRANACITETWGSGASLLRKEIAGDACWALRRSRPHHSGSAGHPHCNHRADDSPQYSHCLPLLGHGELMGVLHLCIDPVPHSMELSEPSRQQLLQTLANQAALSCANLRLRNTLRQQSIIDPLTGLNNRRVIDEHFETRMQHARAQRSDLALLMIDIDHFKSFNDRFGHECGDIALREIGTLLRRSLRHDDVVCRMGGEEFAVLLPSTSLPEAEQAADKLRQAVQLLRLQRNGIPLAQLSVSIGIAALGMHGNGTADLLRHADRALYRAKAAGRNRVVVSSQADDTGFHPRMTVVPRSQ
jgi:diguanylate cyclase (GGDEF)-like protein/PAS domain S-box-containing protein